MNSIKQLLKELSIDQNNIEKCKTALRFIYEHLKTVEIIKEKSEAANLFILSCKGLTNKSAAIKNGELIIKAYSELSSSYLDESDYSKDSNAALIHFLWSLNNQEIPLENNLDSITSILANNASKICDIFEIFYIKNEDGEPFFKLANLLKTYISRKSTGKELNNDDIILLCLSLKMFNDLKEKRTIEDIDEIIKKHNLEYITTLSNKSNYDWVSNFKSNGIIVFADESDIYKKTVLVRASEKDYFSDQSNLKKEIDADGTPIGYYVYKKYSENVKFVSLEKVMEDILNNGSEEAFTFLFNEIIFAGRFNVINPKAVYFDSSNGSYHVTNEDCFNDKHIVLNDESIKDNDLQNFKDLFLKNYYQLRINRTTIFKSVLFGLVAEMIMANNSIPACCGFSSIKNMCQNDFIKAMFINSSEQLATNTFFKIISDQFKYFESKEELERINVKDVFVYPFKLDISDVFESMYGFDLTCCQEYTLDRGFDGSFICDNPALEELLNNDNYEEIMDSKVFYCDLIRNRESLDSLNNLIKINKSFKTSSKFLFNDAFIDYLSECDIDSVFDKMDMYQEALTGNNKYYLKDLYSIYTIRFLSFLLYYQINNNAKLHQFLTILDKNFVLNFENIICDNFFDCFEDFLIVPEEGLNADSTLESINNKYWKSPSNYNCNFFHNVLNKKDGHFVNQNNKVIRELLLLFDNSISGVKTTNIIKKYFGFEENNKKTNLYFSSEDNRSVTLEEIIKANDIKNIVIMVLCCTNGAKESIEKMISTESDFFNFLKERITNNLTLSFKNIKFIPENAKLTHEDKAILDDLFDCQSNIDEDNYMVIREFNLTAKYFVPANAVKPKNVFAIFCRKEPKSS